MRCHGRRLARALAALAIAAAACSAPAGAAVLKTGPQVLTAQGNCASEEITPGYSQQAAGVEPKVGDVVYLSVRVDFIVSFDCAADFFSVQVTLPPGVQPATGGSNVPICRRFGSNAQGQTVFDSRAAANCPGSVSFDAVTRRFELRPKASPVLPDVGGPAGSFWFVGIRAPQESQEYPSVQLLVPVTATQTMTNQPVSYLVCAVGTSCVMASVGMTVGAAPAGSTTEVSFPEGVATTAVGARIPFGINTGAATQYYLKVDAATSPTFASGHACAGLPTTFAAPGSVPFRGPFSSEIQFGDLQQGGTTCFLAPLTTYTYKACTVNTGTLADLACRAGTLTTGAVSSTLRSPADTPADRPDSTRMTVRGQVLGGHPAGTLLLQRRASGSSAAFTNISLGALSQTTADGPELAADLTGLAAWSVLEMRACYQAGSLMCSTSADVVAGYAEATGAATAVGDHTATFGGFPSAPSPAGTLTFRAGTSTTAVAAKLPVVATRSLTAVAGTTATPFSATATGLDSGTTYRWAVCFDVPATAGVEDCSQVRTFTTTGTAPDRAAPRIRLTVKGTPRRGRRVTLKVRATDPSGVRRVTIKVGSAKARTGATQRVRLPRRGTTVKVVVKATDRAGNTGTLAKTLKLRP